jgi:CheY-like chemotaxis protein
MGMARVLIIDDDVELCASAERLRSEDCAIEAIHNGQRGLERVLSEDYALVILDLMLSGMKGLDVRRHPRTQLWQLRCAQNPQCTRSGRLVPISVRPAKAGMNSG